MILTNLAHTKEVERLHPDLKTLFDYVRTHDLLSAPTGRIELRGEEVFINNVNPQCVSVEEQPLEGHRAYIDVHILLQGEETIGWLNLADAHELKTPYNEADDFLLYADRPQNYIRLLPGQCLLAWPEDLHAPVIGQGRIRKLIGKIKI